MLEDGKEKKIRFIKDHSIIKTLLYLDTPSPGLKLTNTDYRSERPRFAVKAMVSI